MRRGLLRIARIETNGFSDQSEIVGNFQRVLDVHEMGPGFRPVFPGMRRRIMADVVVLPVRRGSVGIVVLQGLLIIGLFVAEKSAEAVKIISIADQAVPVIVANLVPKMSEQGTQGLFHCIANFFADGVVRFGDVQRDETIFMAGHDFGDAAVGVHSIFEESKREPRFSGSSRYLFARGNLKRRSV